jgi:hypothetical protein
MFEAVKSSRDLGLWLEADAAVKAGKAFDFSTCAAIRLLRDSAANPCIALQLLFSALQPAYRCQKRFPRALHIFRLSPAHLT